MTDTEKMEKHITSTKRLGEVLHKSLGSDYRAISQPVGREFSGWMRHQKRLTGIGSRKVRD